MQHKDIWHFPRDQLAESIIQMFNIGLSSALTFFAPRRMGKTEFLCKDILPRAQQEGWNVHYYSFLEDKDHSYNAYFKSLLAFSIEIGAIKKPSRFFSHIKKISGQAAGIQAAIELDTTKDTAIRTSFLELISHAAKQHKIILLLDEVQTLAFAKKNAPLLTSLRTALDLHKDRVKAIFTGSSREGLRHMFSHASAPFFHFGQNIDFPELGKDFTNHLADTYYKVTGRRLNKKNLWQAFQKMSYVPQLIRSLVERLALNPHLNIELAQQQILADLQDDRGYHTKWSALSALEQLLLTWISQDKLAFFSQSSRTTLARLLQQDAVKISTIQSALRKLARKRFIIRSTYDNAYVIDDPNFKSWLQQHKETSNI